MEVTSKKFKVIILVMSCFFKACYPQTFEMLSQNYCLNLGGIEDNLSCADVAQHTGNCFPRSSLCDGVLDCDDGSDEGIWSVHLFCDEDPPVIDCDGSQTFPLEMVCNGVDDCNNVADETLSICDNKCLAPGYAACDPNQECLNSRFLSRCGDCLPGLVDITGGLGQVFCLAGSFPLQGDSTVFIEGGENPVQVCANFIITTSEVISVPVTFTSTMEIQGPCVDGDIRLSDGENNFEGRVEICFEETWGTICGADSWDIRDAEVVCRQLGFNATGALALNGASHGQGTGPIHFDAVACTGREERLISCPRRDTVRFECSHEDDSGVRCQAPLGADALDRCADGDIQLVGGRGDFEGRVEICFGGTWGTVCEHGFTRRFTYSEAGVICRQLGYNFTGADHFLGGFFTPGTGPIFIDELECTGDEERLISCRYNPIGVHNCEHSDDAGVKCPTILDDAELNRCDEEGDIRLLGGNSVFEGRVEVCIGGSWGTVCERGWDNRDAEVVCRQLGYSTTGALAFVDAYFGQGFGRSVELNEVRCSRSEERLVLCPYSPPINCYHRHDVGVRCSSPAEPNADADYMQITTALSFTSEAQTQCVSFNITDDAVTESLELFTINLGSARADITILDRNALVLPDAIFLEGAANPVQLCATLVLPDNSPPLEVVFLNPFILPLIFTAGTAGDDDYVPISTSLSFTSIPQTTCILFNIVECMLVEPTEHFTITAGPATATMTIIDSDALVITNSVVSEDDSIIQLLATLAANVTSVLSVPVTFRDGTAAENTDFLPLSSNISFSSTTQNESILFSVINDNVVETPEVFYVSVGSITAIITIMDDDVPVFGFSAQSYNGSETTMDVTAQIDVVNGVTFGFTATLECRKILSSSFGSTSMSATAEDLVDSEPVYVIFAPGSTSAVVTVPVVDDKLLEETEQFSMLLVNPSLGSVDPSADFATVSIIDNDIIDECSEGIHNCTDSTVCSDLRDGFLCNCLPGFNRTESQVSCDDVDECLSSSLHNCSALEVCRNIPGSYICECQDGYTFAQDDVTCIDVNECLLPDLENCSSLDICVNELGSFRCDCIEGYERKADDSCGDIDECSLIASPCSDGCTNTNGSFNCSCPGGMELNSDMSTCSVSLNVIIPVVVFSVILLIAIILVIFGTTLWSRFRKWKRNQMKIAKVLSEIGTNPNSANIYLQNREISLIPKSLIISIDELTFVNKVLGVGEFGIVHKARYQTEVVAVKTMKGFFDDASITELVDEILKMKDFSHMNILTLMGVALDSRKTPCLVMPFMLNGSLCEYLRKEDVREELLWCKEESAEEAVSKASRTLTNFCWQIAMGMEYLSGNKVIHRDLAARNCMLDMNHVIKVADFGLSVSMNDEKNYFRSEKESGEKLPVKWMAPESLLYRKFSELTDVWSFGVTCWEVFSCGKVPYPTIKATKLLSEIRNGNTLESPENKACSDAMYRIMHGCWAYDPAQRPNFSTMVVSIGENLAANAEYLIMSPTKTANPYSM